MSTGAASPFYASLFFKCSTYEGDINEWGFCPLLSLGVCWFCCWLPVYNPNLLGLSQVMPPLLEVGVCWLGFDFVLDGVLEFGWFSFWYCWKLLAELGLIIVSG